MKQNPKKAGGEFYLKLTGKEVRLKNTYDTRNSDRNRKDAEPITIGVELGL